MAAPKVDRYGTRWRLAVHEAGHAVVCRAVGRCVGAVKIPTGSEGCDRFYEVPSLVPDLEVDGRTRIALERTMMIAFAGVEAEMGGVLAGADLTAAAVDLDSALTLALRASGGEPDEAEAYAEWLRLRTRNLLREPMWWAAVESLAERLLAEDSLGGETCREIIHQAVEVNSHRR